ncbi:MAG: DNA double-strand break repair nuclease NurA, partial [Candidatus Promineifilaceae bacterium]
KHAGGWLIGYIERPQTTAVVKLLQTLDIEKDGFDLSILNERPQIHDIDLFRRVLKAGERSAVFSVVNESTNYAPFREANQEICFFYYRPPGGDVSRVDMPKWLAQQEEVVEAIHALLQDQCLLLGNYPYVLTRADEIAVVRGSDREYLEHLIAGEMERRSIFGIMTGKQFGKELSRGGKGKHSL